MNNEIVTNSGISGRRSFLKQMSIGTVSLALGSLYQLGNAFAAPKRSEVSFMTGNDQRETTYQVLKPLKKEIKKAIQDKQVVIKINSGQVAKDVWLNATDVNNVRGILDFLKPIYDKTVIVAESTAAGPTKEGLQSTMTGF